MLKMFKPLALVSLALIAGSASAAKIEFDGLVGEGAVKTYKESGYVVTATKGKDLVAESAPDAQLQSSGFTFAATAGNKNQDFDLNSFYLDFGTASDVKLTYTVDGLDTTIDLADASTGFFTVNKNDIFSFTGLDDLSSFSLAAYNRKGNVVSNAPFEIDTIRVSPDVAAAVPEPGSLALMFAGLGIVGTLARRRRS
jgi:hypothetical protein